MVKPNPKTRVSTYFNLKRSQSVLDFVDIPIGKDVPVFLDPSRLRAMPSTWASECVSLLQTYFHTLLEHLRAGRKSEGIALLTELSERNEFHLGLSKGTSAGKAIGREFAERIWKALAKSAAARSGLLQDLEDTCLFIEGIGPDRLSDAVCNIIRGPLIRYTQMMCRYYGIPLTKDVASGPVWDPVRKGWSDSLVELPVGPFGILLLTPKLAVRHRLSYDPQQYYTHFLLPTMQAAEKQLNTALVRTLKDGRKRVTKKDLRNKYGADKLAISVQTQRLPDALDEFRLAHRTSQPLDHKTLADVERSPAPDFAKLLDDVCNLSPGNDDAPAYEDAVEKLLSALFYPSLAFPTKQHALHDGRKRVDITYVNEAQRGFFAWLALHYPCAHIFIECKNYGKELANPELDQISGRFSQRRGRVGLLVCRSLEKAALMEKRCRDTADDDRGFVIALTDADLKQLVKDYLDGDASPEYPLLRQKFGKLIN